MAKNSFDFDFVTNSPYACQNDQATSSNDDENLICKSVKLTASVRPIKSKFTLIVAALHLVCHIFSTAVMSFSTSTIEVPMAVQRARENQVRRYAAYLQRGLDGTEADDMVDEEEAGD